MTIVCLPIDNSGGTPAYTAQQFRQAVGGLLYNGTARPLGSQSGTVLGSAPALTVTTANWSVGPGNFVVDAAFTTTQAPYLVSNDTSLSGTMTAANATQSRIDAIDLQISDTAIDSSGARLAQFVYAVGTAGSGLAPATTARSTRIATINVPASGGGSPTITQYPVYSVAAGGVVPVFGAPTRDALITAPADGMMCYLTDVDQLQIYNGTSWVSANAVRGGRQFIGTRSGTSDNFSSGSFVNLLTATLPSTAPAGVYIVSSIVDINSTVNTTGALRITDPAGNNLTGDKAINPITAVNRNVVPWSGGFTWTGGAGTVNTLISVASGTGGVFNPGANLTVTFIGA